MAQGFVCPADAPFNARSPERARKIRQPQGRIESHGYQLLKSGTSVGANYSEANRAESRANFIHKIGLVEKEIAETQYWLELFEQVHHGDSGEQMALFKESGELLSIFTAIGKSTKANNLKSIERKL